jgi:hypothetical protein
MISGVISSPPTGFRFQSRTRELPGAIRDSPSEPAPSSRTLVVRPATKTDPEPGRPAVGPHMVHDLTGLLDPIG